MKKLTTLLSVSIVLLTFSSCKKNFMNMDGTDIEKSVKAGYQYNTWIIDDDNTSQHNSTQNGNTFQNKKDPHVTILKNDSYIFEYISSNNNLMTEKGTCYINTSSKTITFHPTGGTDYAYDIQALNEEIFTLTANYTKTTYTTNSEGTVVPNVQHLSETLYMEDND